MKEGTGAVAEAASRAPGRGTVPSSIGFLHDGAGRGARNMAVDEALMVRAREGRVTLRFYGWDPGCLSLGRNQAAAGRYDRELARERGIDVVRRPTGGRAVYHHRELTYAVTAPAELWGGLRASYLRINRALLRGLRRLGVGTTAAGTAGADGGSGEADAERDSDRAAGAGEGHPRRAPRPTARACFRDPLPGEVTAAGRKLIGSAQWRRDGALLQHGSLLLHDDQHVVEELRLGDAAATAARPRAAALSDLLPRLPDRAEIAAALRAGFEEELGLPVRDGGLSTEERRAVRRLRERFRDPEWTWRR